MHFINVILLCLSVSAFAQESIIQFRGQNAETIKVDRMVNVVRKVPVEVPSTCVRQIPYQNHECNNETYYTQECHDVPAAQRCWTEHDRVCQTVTRTRQECTPGPSRNVCHTQPTREVCHDRPDRQECSSVTRYREECSTGSSRQVCVDRPSREVCVERPTREVCRTNASGQQSCQTVGGGQHCTTVGGGQSCHDVPGERSCRSVPYSDQECRTVDGGQSCQTVGGGQSCHEERGADVCHNVSYNDQECHDVPRNECETVPAHEECRNIPHTREVCGEVTRYRPENYACMKTEMQDRTFAKQLTGLLNVNFATNGLVEEFPLSVLLAPKTNEMKEFTMKAALKKEPKVLVFLNKNAVKVSEETEKEIKLEGSMNLEILDASMINQVFPESLEGASLNKHSHLLTIALDGQMSATGTIELEITAKKFLRKTHTVAKLSEKYPSQRIKIVGNQLQIDLRGLVVGKVKKSMHMDVKLTSPLSAKGELLNAQKPKSEEEYEVFVSLE